MAIVILRRSDLMPVYGNLEITKIRADHFGFDPENRWRADLIVFIEHNEIKILQGLDWPYGKPMSAAELLKYIANHVA